MLQLTQYQEKALDSLKRYFQLCDEEKDANMAFYKATSEIWETGIPYRPVPVSDLSQIPYVCLRLPTGGGKTLLACHSIAVGNQEYLKKDNSIVLWLVPSNAIKEQTLNALKDRNHHYRQALNSRLGQVTVMDVEEALYLQRSTVIGSTTIIISTLQAFRVEDKEGRKVYSSSGNLEHHFTKLAPELECKLLKSENGVIQYSLANVLRINRPLVIVDEAHNARTQLSFDTLAQFRPSAIIEFTATPATKENPSNILHSVSAAELKAENMIKLPIRLSTKTDWKSTLADAIVQREDLEQKAKIEFQKTGEYIRPLMLLQAQNKSKKLETLDTEAIKTALITEFKIPESQIAVATGTQREIDDINLLDNDCEIRYIITVQALKEGWDCPFAYVLCSVNEVHASTSVEQILGRILRLPCKTPKKENSLNKAYAFITSSRFAETAKSLIDALVENGFNNQEAQEFISVYQPDMPDFSLYSSFQPVQPRTIQMPEVPSVRDLSKTLREKVSIDTKSRTITLNAPLQPEEVDEFKQHLVMEESQEYFVSEVQKHNEKAVVLLQHPSERNEIFDVPQLCLIQDDMLELFEEQTLMDYGWELLDFDATLSAEEFALFMEEGNVLGEIDIEKSGELKSRFIPELNKEIALIDIVDSSWTQGELIYNLAKNLDYPEITPQEKEQFIHVLIGNLLDEKNIPLVQLVRKRFVLRKIIDRKIKNYRKNAKRKIYQDLLFGDESLEVSVCLEHSFNFNPDQYPARFNCSQSHMFRKHYYPAVGELDDKGEEFNCACFIDGLDEVEFWVRNLERNPDFSFWLQTSTDKFYPDFVCKLKDGRILVVEYKGADRWSNEDSREKRRLGELWEAKSNGKCLFVMPEGNRPEEIKVAIGK
ncbi:MAG: DEAD/DEAH box helicase family protein [Victivallales bacterium]|nr:DEAD/DEAH box helicase family protein [Victivallales bacterium]